MKPLEPRLKKYSVFDLMAGPPDVQTYFPKVTNQDFQNAFIDGIAPSLIRDGEITSNLTLKSVVRMHLVDGIEEPEVELGKAIMFVDVADGDLKIKFGDGTLKVIAADT